jgi:hypothetical protein
LVAYLIPPKINATNQESVFSLTLMLNGEKKNIGVPLFPSMPKGEIVGMFYRQYMLVIDGKYNNDDDLSTGRM